MLAPFFNFLVDAVGSGDGLVVGIIDEGCEEVSLKVDLVDGVVDSNRSTSKTKGGFRFEFFDEFWFGDLNNGRCCNFFGNGNLGCSEASFRLLFADRRFI
jgi:hypothetical protein